MTTIALVLLVVWLSASLWSMVTLDYVTLTGWMRRDWNLVALVALILAGAQHSYLGLRVIVEDYVSHAGKRIAMLLVLRFAHGLVAAAGVIGVFEVAFGSRT